MTIEILHKFLLWIMIGCCYLHTTQSAKILGLFPHASEGHFAVMRAVMTELAKRDHNVTIFTSHRLNEKSDNLHEFIIQPEFDFWTKLQEQAAPKGGLDELVKLTPTQLRQSLAIVGAAGVDYFLSQKPMQSLLQLSQKDFDYDLIIVDVFYTEALFAFGHIHQKPVIGIVNTNFADYMNGVQESIVPSACSPINFAGHEHKAEVGYWQRLTNVRRCIARRKQFVQQHYAAQEKEIRKHFKVSTSIHELQAELSVLLLNNHVPLLKPRPLLQNIVPAGGLHISAPRELPWHIKRFLDESRAGVIYMNLGNEQRCATLPKVKLDALFTSLAKRKEHILWTCHDVQKIDNMPKNMMIQHDVPQTDILAHPHVRVFLMNGDILNVQEGIVRHVPMLGLPSFDTEEANMVLVEQLGVGLKLIPGNITETSLTWALDTLTANKHYGVQIRKVSSEYRDRPLGALASTMFWIDYVLRHNGGAQLKTPGIGIPLNQLHLFDLFAFYCGWAIVVIAFLIGLYYLTLFVLKKKQTEKLYSKLN